MILHGWKDIAKYLGSGVRTVQRWEKLGLPVRRPTAGAVVAITKEIDVWVKLAPAASTSHEAKASDRFRYQILIADNDERFLVRLAAQLVDDGYDVRTARDGFEALAVMREAVPDLLVSDLKMPNMSGFELLSIVRRRFPAISVIVCSSEFVAAGNPQLLCDRYMEKAGNVTSKLKEAVGELLSQSPLRSQPAKFVVAPAWLPRSSMGISY